MYLTRMHKSAGVLPSAILVITMLLIPGCGSDSPTDPGGMVTPVGPTAEFSSNVGSGAGALTVQFLDTSDPGSSAITAWAWTFGDGTSSALQNPAHTYATPGFYNVALAVTSSVGTSSKAAPLALAIAPVAGFSVSQTSGLAPLTVQFVDTSRSDSAPITSWVWDFGDGTSSTLQSPSHTYSTGDYAVSLTVTSSLGSDTRTLPGQINAVGSAGELKAVALKKYAPRVILAASGLQGSGRYWPSSVEWAMPNLTRIKVGANHRLQTTQSLETATTVLPYFHGPDAAELPSMPAYAFWIEDPSRPRSWVDLVYFFYYPYNRGKDAFGSVWGNHVGDWEHVTVRMQLSTLEPLSVALSAHSGGSFRTWDQMEKTSDGHPVVYSAWGSNANYSRPGDYVYKTIDVPGYIPVDDIPLVDRCSSSTEGTTWDTWNSVEVFDFYKQEGLGSKPWPGWMGTDFENPASEAVWRWGNLERVCEFDHGVPLFDPLDFGACLLENGPTGPVSKSSVWNVDKFE